MPMAIPLTIRLAPVVVTVVGVTAAAASLYLADKAWNMMHSDSSGETAATPELHGPLAPGSKDSDLGCIYCVSGDKTPSGLPYVGSADDKDKRARTATDGRDRDGAEIRGTYPKGDRETRQNEEQKEINNQGGVNELDNKRNEVRPSAWEGRGIPPPTSP
jgi:hypothetical protein